MPKFQAPDHVTGIHTSVGTHYMADEKGQIDVPDDAHVAELNSLQVAGWTRVGEAAAPAAPVKQPVASKQPDTPAAE